MSLISEVSEVGMKESAKRRFIKGSLAAPVVLTVSSASATAMTSFGRCLRNGPGQTQPAFFIDPTRGADRFVRKLVKVDQLWQAGEIKGTFYMDPVLNRYLDAGATFSAEFRVGDVAGRLEGHTAFRPLGARLFRRHDCGSVPLHHAAEADWVHDYDNELLQLFRRLT